MIPFHHTRASGAGYISRGFDRQVGYGPTADRLGQSGKAIGDKNRECSMAELAANVPFGVGNSPNPNRNVGDAFHRPWRVRQSPMGDQVQFRASKVGP